jgi:hypothetical protein
MASTIFRRSAYLDDARFGTLAYWERIGPVLGTPLMIWWTAWYISLQHELILGHPTRRPWLNALFGYLPLAAWGDMGPLRRRLHWFNKTFVGRLLVGPALAVSATWIDAVRQSLRGEWRDVPMWLAHLTLLAALPWWMQERCGVSALYCILVKSPSRG